MTDEEMTLDRAREVHATAGHKKTLKATVAEALGLCLLEIDRYQRTMEDALHANIEMTNAIQDRRAEVERLRSKLADGRAAVVGMLTTTADAYSRAMALMGDEAGEGEGEGR